MKNPQPFSDVLLLLNCEKYTQEAKSLSERLGCKIVYSRSEIPQDSTVLSFDEDGVSLHKQGLNIKGDFSLLYRRFPEHNLRNEMLIKASGIYRAKGNPGSGQVPFAIDATAGLGEDAFLLAAAGYQVLLFERDPVIAVLLRDSLQREYEDPKIREILQRITFSEKNSIPVLQSLKEKPDLILLDPMFPQRQKSALVKKKFQLLHLLEKPCTDEEDLLEAAFTARPGRIIVKRPLNGPFLADRKPSYSLKGKSIRYDCYILPG